MRSRMRILAGISFVGLAFFVCQSIDAKGLTWQQVGAEAVQQTEATKEPIVSLNEIPKSARVIAEWEQAVGTMIAWPFAVPDELIVELANDDRLFVLVNPGKQDKAKEKIDSLKIDPKRVEFIECSVASIWPRDWGPHQIFQDTGDLSVIDHRFEGYPVFPRENDKAEFTYRPGKGDDAVCPEFAKALQHKSIEFPAYLTGGNFLVDGHGTAFCTQAQIDENRAVVDEATYRQMLSDYLGIEQLVVLENTETRGIQHIDCWLKVLGPERLLVKRAPEGHPEAEPLERNVKLLSSLNNAFGRNYEILRIDCPEIEVRGGYSEEQPIAAYTNSLILNGKVYVPLFGVEGDKQAIKTWQEALPGYEVKGFTWNRWKHFDALHCRTRAVFDSDLLRLEHPPLTDEVAFDEKGHAIVVTIEDMSQQGIDPEKCFVKFRSKNGAWDSVSLLPLNVENRWVAVLPSFPVGTEVEYVVSASSQSERVATHPRMAPEVVHRFKIAKQEP